MNKLKQCQQQIILKLSKSLIIYSRDFEVIRSESTEDMMGPTTDIEIEDHADLSMFDIIDKIGKGSFGMVYLV